MPPASIAFFTSSIVVSAVRVSAVVVIDMPVSAIPDESFERGAIRVPNLSAPPTRLALKRADFNALIDFGFVHFSI